MQHNFQSMSKKPSIDTAAIWIILIHKSLSDLHSCVWLLTDYTQVRTEYSRANKLAFKCIFQPAGFASEHKEETTGLGSLRNPSTVCIGTPYCQIKWHG